MPATSAERLRQDLTRCREILRHGSKSFYAASLFLPPRVRAPASVVYAFCRVADDAVDLASPRESPAALDWLRERLDDVYRDAPRDHPVDRCMADVVARYRIPRQIPEALFEGFAWDVEGRRYPDTPALQAYCSRVAATVGVMMTLLMGRRDRPTLARAVDLGVAMQITNICRDVGEDARNGRVYLPLDALAWVGLEPDELLRAPAPSPALAAVIDGVLRDADRLYRRSDPGVAMLPRDCRVSIRAARLLYSAIGDEVRRHGLDSVTRRAVVPTVTRLGLLLRSLAALVSVTREPSPDDPPPLDAARFLLDAVDA